MCFFGAAAAICVGGCAEQKVNAAEKVARKEVRLTIYKDDFAMVREVLPVGLRAGRNEIALEQVSSALDPRSAGVDKLTASAACIAGLAAYPGTQNLRLVA